MIYSLAATAKNHGSNPYEYIRDLPTQLPAAKNSDISRFLLRSWQPPEQEESKKNVRESLAANPTPIAAPAAQGRDMGLPEAYREILLHPLRYRRRPRAREAGGAPHPAHLHDRPGLRNNTRPRRIPGNQATPQSTTHLRHTNHAKGTENRPRNTRTTRKGKP